MSKIIAKHSYYLIEDVDEIPKSISYDLSVWNAAYFRKDYIGLYYNEDKNELRIPRGYPETSLRNIFSDRHFTVDKNGYSKYDNIDINLTAPPRDYRQRHILTFMIGKMPYEYVSRFSQIFVDLDTGD